MTYTLQYFDNPTSTLSLQQKYSDDEEDPQQTSPNYEQISNTEDFRNFFRRSVIRLKGIASKFKNPSLNLESSLVITFGVIRAQEVVQESYLSLVKLPDVDTCHKNHELRLTFQNLKEQLVYIAKQAKGERVASPERSLLLDNIPSLQTEDALVHFICCLPPSEQYSKFTLESVKFVSELFSEINRASTTKPFTGNRTLDLGMIHQNPANQEEGVNNEEPTTQRDEKSQFDEGDDEAHSSHSEGRKRTFPEDTGRDDDNEDDDEQDRNIKLLEQSIDKLKEEMYHKLNVPLSKPLKSPMSETPLESQRHEEILKTNRSIDTLQRILEKKEKLEWESNQALKNKIQRLKSRNKKLQEELFTMSEMLRERDETIAQYEAEVSRSQRELTASNKKINDQRMRQENVKKLRHELHEVVEEMKRKLYAKRAKYKEALERVSSEHQKTVEAFIELNTEHQNLQIKYEKDREAAGQGEEKLSSEIKKLKEELTKKTQLLTESKVSAERKEDMIVELKHQLHEERTNKKLLSEEHTSLAQKFESMKKQLMKAETDNENLLRLLESEREALSSNKKSELQRIKEKHQETKKELKKAEQMIRQLEQELMIVKRDHDRCRESEMGLREAKEQTLRLSKEIELLQEKNNQLTRQHNEDKQKDSEKILSMQSEITRLSADNSELCKDITKLTSQNEVLLKEEKQRTTLLDKYENQLEYLQQHQMQEIQDMHSKIQDFVNQIAFLRAENEQKNKVVNDLAQTLAAAEKDRDEYMRCYMDCKKENKALKKNIKLIDAKMKQLIDVNRPREESYEYEEGGGEAFDEEEGISQEPSDYSDEEEEKYK